MSRKFHSRNFTPSSIDHNLNKIGSFIQPQRGSFTSLNQSPISKKTVLRQGDIKIEDSSRRNYLTGIQNKLMANEEINALIDNYPYDQPVFDYKYISQNMPSGILLFKVWILTTKNLMMETKRNSVNRKHLDVI